ncbi:MAG: cysteine--tRNA ligase [Candidatus Woesearchaeota archaeon]
MKIKQLQFYNTKTRKVERFIPKNKELVKIYSCGPTVYSYQHIGNMKAAVFSDILRRVIKYAGYKLYSVQNITDVGHLTDDDLLSDDGEDKMLKAAKKENKSPLQIAQYYTDYYFKDLERLHVELPDVMPKATEHIQEQLNLIEKLEQNEVTYTTSDGVYFNVAKFPQYGFLSGQKLEEKEAGARVEVNNEKINPQDFALWKFTTGKHEQHLMKWNSKWGVGFPGWHIECSAMGHKYLGEHIDIHTGGVDHIPIHHENEIAQNVCSGCIKDVTFWMHNGHLTVNGEKMSKSVGNVYLIEDLVKKGYHPLALRLLFLQSNYRKTSDFTFELLHSAQQNLNKIHQFVRELELRKVNSGEELNKDLQEQINRELEEFNIAVCDDLNTAKAIKNIYSVISYLNSLQEVSQKDKELVIGFFNTVNRVLGILEQNKAQNKIPQKIYDLAVKRRDAKVSKDFKLADELREEIQNLGFNIKDDKKVEGGFILTEK